MSDQATAAADALASGSARADDRKPRRVRGIMADGRQRSLTAIITMIVLCVLWTLPTVGLLITSVRDRDSQAETGWWTALGTGGWTFDNYRGVFDRAEIGTALLNSVIVAGIATMTLLSSAVPMSALSKTPS